VADNGPGIPPEMREDLFQRRSTSASRGGGVGLPLSIRIVEAHGGALNYAAGDDGGARLTISLPIARTGGVLIERCGNF
jgi:signal transduction histidine kinase